MKGIDIINRDVLSAICGKKVLFITTKNIDYIRNTQEIEYLQKTAGSLEVIGYKDKSYIKRLVKIYAKIVTMSLKKFEVVFIGFAPQLVIPIFFYKFKGKLVIEDFFISLYDTMINDRKKFKNSGLAAKILLWVDKFTLKKTDVIVVDTHAHGKYFINALGATESKIKVCYLSADKSIYYPRDFYKKDKSKFNVLYFGSILPLQGVDVIFQCAEKMVDIPSLFFQIIGPVDKEDLMKYKELKNITFIPWLSQEKLADKIGEADLCLAGHFNDKIDKAKRTIPGKAYIYEAMKKPMILGNNLANRELFEEDDENYYFVEMGSPDKLKDKILYIMNGKYK